MTFSWAQTKQLAIEIKQRRARCMCKLGHSDMKLKHSDWVKDAQRGDYTILNKKIREQVLLTQKRQETFIRKLHQNG